MTADKTPEIINKMFDDISGEYDFMNDVISFGFHRLIKNRCINLLNIKDGYNIVDLCCGTGDLARLIKKNYPKTHVTGMDFSEKMINIAKNIKQKADIQFLHGDVTNLPFPDNSFDAVTMAFGLRNIYNAEKAVEEAYRILKPDGLFMHIDFGEKNFAGSIFDFMALFLARFFSNNYSAYSYLIKSKQEFLKPDDLIKDFEKKGFKKLRREDFIFKIISCQIMRKCSKQ